MTCRAEHSAPFRAALAAAALGLLAIPASAAPGDEPIEAALQALLRGDGISAEVELKRAQAAGVARERIAALMGEALMAQGDYAGARRWLAPAKFTAGERLRGFHALARLELIEGNLEAAALAFTRLLEQHEGTAEVWVDIGRLRYRSGLHHQAIEASLTALKRDPKDPRALEFRGQLVRDSDGLLAALPWFASGVKAYPDDLGLLSELAATLGEAGRTIEMLQITRHMIELDPKNSPAFYLQAVLAARAGKYKLARSLLWRVDDGFRDNVPAIQMLDGVLEMRAGNTASAVEIFGRLADDQPDNPSFQRLLGDALLKDGAAREVLDRFRPLADREGASPFVQALVGRALEMLGDHAGAAPYLDRSAQWEDPVPALLPVGEQGELTIFRWRDDPDRGDVGIALVRQALANEGPAAARAVLDTLAQRHAGSADFEVLAGDVALLDKDADLALENYHSAAKVRRSFPLVRRMAAAYRLKGDALTARKVVAGFLAQHPQHRGAASVLGRMALAEGQWRRAQALLDHAAALGAQDDPRLFAERAAVALHFGENDKAVALAAQAYALQRWNPLIAGIYGQALTAAGGREAEARVLLEKAAKGVSPSATG